MLLKKDGNLIFETIAVPEKSGAVIISLKCEEVIENANYYIEFDCPKNLKYFSDKMVFSEDTFNVQVSSLLFSYVGEIFAQVVIRNDEYEVVKKSFKSIKPLFVVEESINADKVLTGPTGKDFFAKAQEAISEVKKIGEELLTARDNGEFVGEQGVQGEKGDRGEKGDAGAITQSEVVQIGSYTRILLDTDKTVKLPSYNGSDMVFVTLLVETMEDIHILNIESEDDVVWANNDMLNISLPNRMYEIRLRTIGDGRFVGYWNVV